MLGRSAAGIGATTLTMCAQPGAATMGLLNAMTPSRFEWSRCRELTNFSHSFWVVLSISTVFYSSPRVSEGFGLRWPMLSWQIVYRKS